MQKNYRCVLLIILFLLVGKDLFAQEARVSLALDSASVEDFFNSIEKQTSYRAYFSNEDVSGLKVTCKYQNEVLGTILQEVMGSLNLKYAVFNRSIYITKDKEILTTFRNIKEKSSGDFKKVVTLNNFEKMESGEISLENKIFEIGNKSKPTTGAKTLTGTIKSSVLGTAVYEANVSVLGSTTTVKTDLDGRYSLVIKDERAVVVVKRVGLQETSRRVMMYGSGELNIEMNDEVFALSEVVVSGERANSIKRPVMGLEKLSMKTIRQTPAVLGEVDVISVLLTLPGVQTVGEAASGFNVRGGATDQNLVLFNDATIYNPSHFFGMFSAFNPDAVSQLELYKSSVPARYGGRLSSVLDVVGKEGNPKKLTGAGGLGLLTGRLSFDGPIGSKTQFFVGARSTYSDWLLKLIPNDAYKNSSASFYDGNFQISHQLTDKDQFQFTGYASNDKFSFERGVSYGYQNRNSNLKWKRKINNKLNGSLTVGYDGFGFDVADVSNADAASKLNYEIGQIFGRVDMDFQLNEKHKLNFGLHSVRYKVKPGSVVPIGESSTTLEKELEAEQALETALFVGDTYTVSENLVVDLGLRYVMYNYLGPKSVNSYSDDVSKTLESVTGTTIYGGGDFIKTYHYPEIRLGVRYTLANNNSVKFGYNSTRQYIHMLSNTTAVTPTDSWKLSDTHIKPQYGDQISLGYYQNFNASKIETSVEVYYKRMRNFLDYKSGAVLVMNENIETDVIGTRARAYGVEFMVKKQTGKLNGWLSYTYSRVQQRTNGFWESEKINDNAYYASNFDKPHSATMVGNYRFSHRLSFSLNSTYSTGRPITLPVGKYNHAGSDRVLYSKRNEYRIPDFFRMDASFNIEGNHKIRKLAHSSWTIGVYNLTGRKNPFSVFYVSEEGRVNGYKLSIFGHQIPFITYNFKF